MATTGNFGQIKDLRVTNLKVGGKRVITDERNINSRSINIDDGCIKNLTVCGNLLVQGTIPGGFIDPVEVTNLKINGDLLMLNDAKLDYMTEEPSPGNEPYGTYTDTYGPMIQGIENYTNTYTTHPINMLTTRNSASVYYGDIPQLDTSIVKSRADSKIKITVSVFGEVHYNSVIVIMRYNASNVFTGEVGTPSSPPPGVNIGVMSWPYDNLLSETANMVHFTVLDTDANTAELYTYKIRIYASSSTTFSLNRVLQAGESTIKEYGTSSIFLEEMENC
jgi:hypothetical protein